MVMGVFRRSAAGPEKLSAASRSLGLDALFRRETPLARGARVYRWAS